MGNPRLALAFAASYFVVSFAVLTLANGQDGVVTIWPASGVAIAALLLVTGIRRHCIFAGIALGSMVANYLVFQDFTLAMGYSIANLAEAAVGGYLLSGIGRQQDSFYTTQTVIRFCLGAVAAAGVSSGLAAILTLGTSSDLIISWFATDMLGILVIVPLIVSFRRTSVMALSRDDWFRLLASLAVVAVTSIAVFTQASYLLLFLPLTVVVFATYFAGPRGATASVTLIAVVGSAVTMQAGAPVHQVWRSNEMGAVLFFQFYLLVLLLSALPLAAMLHERESQFRQIARTNSWLAMSEQISRVGHWRLSLVSDELFWSDEVYRIHGLDPEADKDLDMAVNHYHPEDRDLVLAALEAAILSSTPFTFDARILRKDGELRYVHAQGDVEQDEAGKSVAIFGVFQDVTDQVMAVKRLGDEKRQAEVEAAQAKLLAETDSLTGIANRRKAMEVLRLECLEAARSQSPLSVALLDIDKFKSINDRLGHGVGDEVLVRVAETCAAMIRGSDFIGRIGGEEFMLVLRNSTSQSAALVGERVRAAVADIVWDIPGLDGVTVSLGLSTLHDLPEAPELLKLADIALYRAKHEGRNRLCIAA